jgi:hypothetical protein
MLALLVCLLVPGAVRAARLLAAPAPAPAPAARADWSDALLHAPAPAEPAAPAADALRVAGVKVRLVVHRGGERLPGGEKVARRGGVVEGAAEYELARPARAGERLLLLNYAAVLPREPTELDEVAVATYADGPFQAGRLDLLGQEGAVARRVGARGDVEVELPSGATSFRLSYRVKVPHRYWPLGCSRGRCSLAGAVAPLPSVPAVGGPDLPPGRVIDPVRWEVEDVRFAAAASDEQARQLGGDEIVVTRETLGGDGRMAYPSIFWGKRWRRVRDTYRGVEIEVLHTLWRPADHVPSERRAQLYRDVPGHALLVAREAVDIARAAGIEPPVGARFTVVQGPLRANVAEAHPTAVVLSDQFLQLWPSSRFLQFHVAVAARASFDLVTYGALVGKHDPSTDLWLHDMLAVALLEVWRVHRSTKDEYVSDIFRRFTFVPMVDNFLYSGQATFASAYFRGADDVMPARVHPLFFSHELPTGRRLHEKLGDLMTPSQRAQLYRRLTTDLSADPKRLAEDAYGHTLEWFFDQWLAPHAALDYSVRSVKSARSGDRWQHVITVGRDGDRGVIEPVQVLVYERGGKRHFLVWNGDDLEPDAHAGAVPRSASHTFTLVTDRPLRAVSVDPRARLAETPLPPQDNVDPLFNNRSPAGTRFIYSGFGIEIAASEFLAAETAAARFQAVSGRVLFEANKRRDLRNTGHLQVYRDRESAAALGGGVSLWFGDKVNRRRRRARVRLFTEFAWLNPRGLDQVGGVRFNQSASIQDDNRKFSLFPDRGHRLVFGVTAGQTVRFDPAGPDNRFSLQLQGSWVQLWPLAHQHVLASRLEAAVMIPIRSQPEYRSLLRAGGVDGLGGYGGNEIFGRALMLAQLEYRHLYVRNLDVNILHLLWLRGLGGSLFTGAATVSHCDDYRGWFGKESWYAQVGYGVTAVTQVLGVTPQLLRFDVAVPLIRYQNLRCLGNVHPDYLGEVQGIPPGEFSLPRVGINLTFLQPF